MKYIWEKEDIQCGHFAFDSAGSALLITYSDKDGTREDDARWGFTCVNDGQADYRGMTKADIAELFTKMGATPKDKPSLEPYRAWRLVKSALDTKEPAND